MDNPRHRYLDMRDWHLNKPTAEVYAWVFSQPPEVVIRHLRERPELWDALCEEIGNNVREGCAVIAQEWAKHYPISVFPEDGTSIDCQSASAMRHASKVIAAAIRERGEENRE